MKLDITATFLELGDATSRNLEFSHRPSESLSYGEETITETNLLEIRRRHPQLVRIRTFPKALEAKTGADWEWHLVGRRLTLKMRVQAKRLQRNGVLKVRHEVKSTGQQQRDLLIAGARTARMKAVYCVYSTEAQRNLWKQPQAPPGYRSLQAGCLLADAKHVLLTTRRLDEIEGECRPWHHLFLPATLTHKKADCFAVDVGNLVEFVSVRIGKAVDLSDSSGWNAPTVDDLNEETGREFDQTGVAETTEEDRIRLEPNTETGGDLARFDEERLRELGIARLMVMDVRGDPESHELREHRSE